MAYLCDLFFLKPVETSTAPYKKPCNLHGKEFGFDRFVALINALSAVRNVIAESTGDEKTGAAIVLKALTAPINQICANAGLEGSVVIDKIMSRNTVGVGYDVSNGQLVDMISAGIVDPTKVTLSALQNAASVAAMILTTESLVTDVKEKDPAAMPAGEPGMGGMY